MASYCTLIEAVAGAMRDADRHQRPFGVFEWGEFGDRSPVYYTHVYWDGDEGQGNLVQVVEPQPKENADGLP